MATNRTDTAPTDTAPTDTAPSDTVLGATPGQTVGPFFGYALPFDRGNELVAPGSPGSIRLHGVLTDGAGDPVPDALLEIWQTDPEGSIVTAGGSLRRDGATFTGWGRAGTDGEGHYGFTTLPPGPTRPGAAPFIMVTVFARGLLDRLFTRAYLPGDHLDTDPLLTALPPERRHTLITVPDHTGLRFDISLQGPGETVFLHYPGHQP
jgi:protocatechuate 3,4-dioxygenase alpha subunit